MHKCYLFLGLFFLCLGVVNAAEEKPRHVNNLTGLAKFNIEFLNPAFENFAKETGFEFSVVILPGDKVNFQSKLPLNLAVINKPVNDDQYNNASVFFQSSVERAKFITLHFESDPEGAYQFLDFTLGSEVQKRLPPAIMLHFRDRVVLKMMEEGIAFDKLISTIMKMMARALDTSWLKALEEGKGQALLQDKRYDRHHAGIDIWYYEFHPVEINYEVNAVHDELSYIASRDDMRSSFLIVEDENKMLKPYNDNALNQKYFKKNSYTFNLLESNVIKPLLTRFTTSHSNDIVSSWVPDNVTSLPKTGLAPSSPLLVHFANEQVLASYEPGSMPPIRCKYIMRMNHLKPGDPMPAMGWIQGYGPWKATRCNMFANDFSELYLPNKQSMWRGYRAGAICVSIAADPDFIALDDLTSAWKYVNGGWPVYFLLGQLDDAPAGHIAVGYPTNAEIKDLNDVKSKGMIIQSGASLGLMPFVKGFGKNSDKAKAYVYVGHIYDKHEPFRWSALDVAVNGLYTEPPTLKSAQEKFAAITESLPKTKEILEITAAVVSDIEARAEQLALSFKENVAFIKETGELVKESKEKLKKAKKDKLSKEEIALYNDTVKYNEGVRTMLEKHQIQIKTKLGKVVKEKRSISAALKKADEAYKKAEVTEQALRSQVETSSKNIQAWDELLSKSSEVFEAERLALMAQGKAMTSWKTIEEEKRKEERAKNKKKK